MWRAGWPFERYPNYYTYGLTKTFCQGCCTSWFQVNLAGMFNNKYFHDRWKSKPQFELIMKKELFVMLIVMLIGVIACNDTEENPKISEAKAIVQEGQWIITYFWESDNDKTSAFSGVNFEFASNGTVTGTKGPTSNTGEWSVTGENDDLYFNLVFTIPANFEELSEDWHIVSISSEKIELDHVSGGSGGTDFLTFEKN